MGLFFTPVGCELLEMQNFCLTHLCILSTYSRVWYIVGAQ